MNRFRKGTAVIAALVLLVFGTVTAFADNESDLQSVQQQMNTQQNKISEAQKKVDSINPMLQSAQVSYETALNEYKSVDSQLKETQGQLETNKEVLAKAEKTLAARTIVLNKRMRDVYKNGQISYLDVLLGATDFTDFTTRLDLLQRVVKQDIDLVMEVKAERELILTKKNELEQNQAQIQQLKNVAAQKKQIMEEKKNGLQSLMNSAINERDAANRAYQELMETSQRIERMIRGGGYNIGHGSGSGAMMWPISGPITSPFGGRNHPVFGDPRFHTGIDIGADYGDTVVAADSGVVIYADWMGGYGKAVMIDHGNGITTLYGHNSQLLVSEGQQIGKGQAVALAGATGYATGPHVHFEVRENGTPVNPMGYLP
ncbi:MAG: peptidoglycan DD-metalloendopeptidase family protein [Sporomusaceae bacterium]|nr:peptidoglycan DD-metalloendopeptidase family protein [Sporomusaceae bacterium]